LIWSFLLWDIENLNFSALRT